MKITKKLLIFTLLFVSVSGKPTLKILSRVHDFVHDLVHDEAKTPEKQVQIHYVHNVPSSPQGNFIGNPYQSPGQYPAVNPYYNPYNIQSAGYTQGTFNDNPYHLGTHSVPYPMTNSIQSETYSLPASQRHSLPAPVDQYESKLYAPSGPAGIYDNSLLLLQDPPYGTGSKKSTHY